MFQPDATGATPEAAQGAAVSPEIVTKAQSVWQSMTDGDVTRQDLVQLWTQIGIPIVKAVALIIVVLLVSRWLARITTGLARKAHVELTLARFFGNLTRYAVLVLGGLAILDTFGIRTTSFAAVIAAVGFSIGMAVSGTMSNVASGVMLLVFRPFKVGDMVSAGGVTGRVEEIGLFATAFDTPDNRRIIVPNTQIFGSTIENTTFHRRRRVDVAVGTAYQADLDTTRAVLMRAAERVEGRLADEAPVVVLNQLGASSVDWSVRVWAKTEDFGAVRERLTRNVKLALDEAGIGIPYPQLDVHVQKLPAQVG